MRYRVDYMMAFFGGFWAVRKKRKYWFGYSIVAVFDELAEAEFCAELMEKGA